MTNKTNQPSALVIVTQADDLHVLQDVLATQAYETIYATQNTAQARAFLEKGAKIHLIFLEFMGDPTDAVAFCHELDRRGLQAHVPVIGIFAEHHEKAPWNGGHLPPGVVASIVSPLQVIEVLACVKRIFSRAGDSHAAGGASIDRYQFAFDGSLDEIAIVDPKLGRVLEVNATFLQRSGFPSNWVLGGRIEALDAVLPLDQRLEIKRKLAQEGYVHFQAQKPRADGSTYLVEVHVRYAVHEGQLIHFYIFREKGELGQYQQALTALSNLIHVGIGDEGMTVLARGIADWLRLDFISLVASAPDQATPLQPLANYHRVLPEPDAPDPMNQPTLQRILDGEELVYPAEAWRILLDDAFISGHHYECLLGLPLRSERQMVIGALLVARREPIETSAPALDGLRILAQHLALVLDLRRAREQGRVYGLQDSLTNLPNRLLFNDHLESTIQEAYCTGEMFAVLFVDLDRFKNINDSMGHHVGDQVLMAVAKRLRSSVRGSDTVARYAGDEFTIILRHVVQREDVIRVAAKIVRVMEAPLVLDEGLELHVTVSIGISFYPDDAAGAERLLNKADVAMYTAKGQGRNNYQTYVAVPEESQQQRLALEAKLSQAERNGELRVYYQPQVDTITQDIVSMEALIRWEHPDLGMISPGFFIPLAEETGLIVPIGEWVLRTACMDTKRWQDRFNLPLRVGVNLSPLQLRQTNLVQVISQVLEETQLEATLLDLEITESLSIKSIPNLIETLQGLRELGCHISIDDFGTGQASLDYIKRLPVDRIKIDQSFVRNIGVDPDDETIVRATITMAHNLNRQVVAEGVETEEHFEFLKLHQCEVLQGYLFSRPLPVASFEKMLLEREQLLETLFHSGANNSGDA